MWLNQGELKKIDAFFYKAIRQILKYKSTFVDRTKTNAFLLKEANRRLNIGNTRHPWKTISAFSDQWQKRREKLLRHVVRTLTIDPMRRCTFEEGTVVPILPPKNRVGRPKKIWASEGLALLWEKYRNKKPPHFPEKYDPMSLDHSDWLTEIAASRDN